MQRTLVVCVTLACIVGCREQSTLTSPHAPTIAAALLDGGHGGNPHFFFLPPIAPVPTPDGPFNPRLLPVVEICTALEAPCAATHVLTTLAPVMVRDTQHYEVNWDTRRLNLPAGTSVRIVVRVGGSHILGFADVDLVSNASVRTRPTSGNIQLASGATLPIKFRIEQGALTPDARCTDCVEQTISTRTSAATVVTSTQLAGAFFPQGSLPQDVTVIIEATPPAPEQECIPVNIDQFPGCYTFATDPGPVSFSTPVIAGICVETEGLTTDQVKSLILYQLDVVNERNVITPLENTPAAFLPCNGLAARRGSTGLLARARDGLLRLVVPAPLNAAHVGVGGLTGSFSKIGWGLPPTMTKVQGDGQFAPPGSTLPTLPAVQLLNQSAQPVSGLPVTFQVIAGGGTVGTTGSGGMTSLAVRTGTDGKAAVTWRIGSSVGTNTLTASQIGALGSPVRFAAAGTVSEAVVDQSSTAATNLGSAINECCRYVAQTFTAGLTGTLAGVNIDVTSGSAHPLNVAIRTVAGGTPTSTILGDRTLSTSSAALSDLITFPELITLTAGLQYAIVVSYPSAPPPGPFQSQGDWAGTSGDLYTAGGEFASVEGTSWFATPGADLHFRTFMSPTATGLGTWTTKTAMPTARGWPAPTAGVINGALYVVGGASIGNPSIGDFGTALPTLEAYDPATNTWTPKSSMSIGREGPSAGVINGVLYVAGGVGSGGDPGLNALEAYDPATNTWTTKASMPTARGGAAAGVINGVLYVAGGRDGTTLFTTVEAYDPGTNTWTTKAPMPTARFAAASGVINGILYVAGGLTARDAEVGVATVEAYDPVTNTWTAKHAMQVARGAPTAGVINGLLYVVGGDGAGGTVEVYDPATDAWTMKASMLTARFTTAAGVVGGVLYVAGGATTSCNCNGLDILEAFTP